MADIDDQNERRIAFALRERVDITVGLIAGLDHGGVPAGGAADGGASSWCCGTEQWIGDKQRGWFDHGIGALLGFEDEATAFVEIDAAGGAGAVTGRGGRER